jgi:hypothetical protein
MQRERFSRHAHRVRIEIRTSIQVVEKSRWRDGRAV